MAIYKLGEILNSKPIYGLSEKALSKGKYKYFRQTDIKLKKTNLFVNIHKNKFMQKGDFFISRAGTIESYYHDSDEKWVYAGYLIKYPINEKIAFSKYIYYWTKSNFGKKELKINSLSGSTMPKLNPNISLNLKINLPSLIIQKKIIDIIEPISQGIKLSKNILNKISNLYRLLQLNSKNEKIKNIIKEYSNGYSYKKINIDNSGKYKIFKIKNISTENSYVKTNFSKNNFLLNGDVLTGLTGTLGTAKIIVDKNWVNNQRTLMLRSSFFLEIKTTIENSIDFLMKNAKGAVQKNISHNDILNLKINTHCYNKTLSDLYLLSSDIKQKLSLLQTKLINLLIK